MSNLWKRSLSMLMAIVMVFSMLPAHAIAAELEEGETESIVAETEAPEVEETEAPEEEETEAPEEEETEAPEEEETEAPEEEETEAPEEEETEAPEEEETEAPEEEETEAPEEEETEAPKAELSGETRKVYFYNVEGWDEVWAAWSFDEEDFDDVAHPGEELDAAAVLEDVYVVTVPVEADDVLFSDGIEVTDELLEEEKLAGVEVTHEVEVELESNEKKDYFDGEGWLNYADEVAAVEAAAAEEAAKKAEEEAAAVAAVQAMINALPTEFASQEEVDNFWDVTVANLDAAIETLTAEQQAQLDTARYDAAMDAAASFTNPEIDDWSTWEEDDWKVLTEAAAPAAPADIAVGGTVVGEGTDDQPTGTIPVGTHWDGPVKSADATCGLIAHTHSDSCYNYKDVVVCDHTHVQECYSNFERCYTAGIGCSHVFHYKTGSSWSTKYYGSSTLVCSHSHVASCYERQKDGLGEGCPTRSWRNGNILEGDVGGWQFYQHTHNNVACYSYTWTLKWDTHKVTWNWKDAEGKDATKVEEKDYGTALTAPEVPETIVVGATTYTFKGWDSKDADNEPDTDLKVTGDMTYTAVYSSETLYSVTFNTDGGSNVNAQKIAKDNTATKPENPTKAGCVFVKWVDANGNEFDFATKITADVALKAVWAPDTNSNGVDDSTETITVNFSNATVKVDGKDATSGTAALYDSTKGTVTIVATPSSGYYVDVTVNNGAVLEGSWKNTDIDSGWLSSDYRNVYTGSFAVESGKSYTVNATSAKYEWSLPKDAVTVSLNGYLFNGITSVPKAEILKAIYGEDVNADLYDGAVDEGWGSITVKLETPFQYKVTLKATDKYPVASDTIMVTASDNRSNADITHNYANGSFNTEDDFKSYFANNCVKVNGEVVDMEVLLNWNGKIEWTKNDDGTYTAVVTLNESKDWLKSSATFSGLTWTVNEYAIEFKDWDGSVILTAKNYPYGTLAGGIEVPADPTRTGYTFTGWDPKVSDVKGDVTYGATYEINKHEVIWTDENGVEQKVEYKYGETVTVPAAPVKEGHTFLGWKVVKVSREAETIYQPGDTFVMGDASVKLVAVWQANSYDVNWVWQNAEGQRTTTVTLPYGTAITVPAEIPTSYKVGNVTYTRTGWTGLTDGATVPVNGVTYTATYTTATAWIVDFDSNGGSEVVDVTVIVPEGETAVVAKPADPTREGYRFDGWLLNGEAYDFATPVTGNITLTAKWVKQVTVSFDGAEVEDQTFDINGTATKPADPIMDQAIFGGWYLGEDKYDFDTPVTEDITLTANWIADTNSNGVADADETVKVAINGNGTVNGNSANFEILYNSKTETTVHLNIVPNLVDGVSKSYISDVTVGGVAQNCTYVDYCVDIDVEVGKGDVVVTFTDCGFEYTKDGEMRFYVGMETPKYETLYNAVIKNPAYNSEFVKSVKYLARPAATYQMQVPVLFQYNVPIINYEIKIGGDMVDIDLDDAWLDVGESFKTLTPEELQKQYDTEIQKIKDKIAAIDLSDISLSNVWDKVQQFATISEELTTLIETISNEAQYLGYHQFGASGLIDENGNAQEILQVIYDDGKMHLVDEAVYVALVDDRIATEITGGNLTFEYDEFSDEDIMNALVLTDVDGNVIEGNLTKHVDLVGTEVGERTFSVYYEGSWDYKPATAEFTLTVIKAPSSVDILDQNITFVSEGTAVKAPVITNKHGEAIDIDVIEFILGLDVAELDIDGDGVKGLEGRMQLILTDELQNILSMVGLEEGVELNINDLISMLTNTGLLDQWGVTSEMVGVLNQILDAINGVVEANNLMIVVGGDYPTNVGAYLHGAVTVDKNYETSYDVGYILIKPQTTEYHLEWSDPALTNAVVTLPMFNAMNKGAYAVEDEEFEVSYVILGVNDDESDILSTDIYGNIKANIWLNADEIKSNGAYLQIAYGIEWGNEFEYAMPIVRGFAVVPAVYDVQLVGKNGTPNDELLKEFNNEPQGFSVIVKNDNGEIIFSDHYQNATALKDNAQLIVNYTGVQTNVQSVNLTTILNKDNKNEPIAKPVHAGVYAVTAFYMELNGDVELDVENLNVEDLYKLFDLADIGMDLGLLVIEPAESTVIVEEKIVNYDSKTDILFKDMVKAGSTAEGLEPDTTIISAGIDTDAAFRESGWDAVRGIVNVDFPAWMDALLEQYAPSVKAGMSVAELKDVLLNKLPDISDKLVELGATEEMVNSLANLTGNVAGVLAEMPDNIRLSFVDDAKANEIGAYIVTAVVTDSDHYPSVDAGYLVVVPDVDMFELKWNFEDANGIFTRDLLDQPDVDLLAKAYDAKSGAYNEDATGKISYMFVGIDSNGKFEHYTDPATLPNGAFIELAYIELDVEGEMAVSDMIARPIVVVASNCKVNVENVETVFNNTAHGVKITVTDLEGREIDTDNGTLTVLYAGLQTNGKAYMDTKAPVHAGVYEALVTYTETIDGELRYYGANAGYVLIDLAESNIDITGETVTYDGNGHTATVVATGSGVTEPDYTLISGGAYVSGDIDEIGVDAFHGNVNIDLPTWMDKALAGYEFVDGVNAAKVADYIKAYRNELIASVKLDKLVEWNVMTEEEAVATIAKLNAYIDELVAVLKKMPTDVALTFVDDITYTEPGAYFYYGIVTDSDHYPSTDTGLLVIEKMDMVYDLLDTEYAWDGTGKMVEINNPNNADALTLIIDRVNNTANFLIDNDAQYLLNTVARILGVEFDGDVQMSTILEKYNGAEVADAIIKMITEAEKLDLPEENAKALAAVKKQLQDLPADGTIVINGELPSEIGTYEVYAVSYSQHYKTNASEAKLLIVPAHFGNILVTDVTYNGTEQTGEVVVMTGDGQVVDPSEYIVTGNKKTNAGAYTVTVEGINHYEGTVTLTWNINKRAATITITPETATMVAGNAVPEFVATVEGTVNGDELKYTMNKNDGKTAGEFSIDAELGNNPNYAVTVVPATLTVQTAVAKINDVYYAKLSDAIAEVKNGETIVLLTTISENVTIKQQKNLSFTIDGNNQTYTGTMTVEGTGYAGNQGQALTIKNVNFVAHKNEQVSIDTVKNTHVRNLTVDGCTFTGTEAAKMTAYGMILRHAYNVVVKNTEGTGLFDLVYGNRSVDGFTAENVTVTDSKNGIFLTYVNSTATFKNVTTHVIESGVGFFDRASGTAIFEECQIDAVTFAQQEGKALKLVFNDEENNLKVAESAGYDKLTIVLNKVDTTVTCATDDLNAITTPELAKDYKVVYDYENGVYKLVERVWVAQVGETKFESIQEAVDAAVNGDTVKVIADHEVACDVNPLVMVAGKDITIDLNGKTVTANVTKTTTRVVFETVADAKLKLTDSVGTGSVIANGEGILHYMFRNGGEMEIAGGNYKLAGLNGGAMFFSLNNNMTVTGGNFTQTTGGWMFNTNLNGVYKIEVTGGTYNRYFIGGNSVTPQENLWGEVVIPKQYGLTDNGDGTWSIVHRIVVTFNDVTVAYGETPNFTYTVEDYDWTGYDVDVEKPVVNAVNVGTYEILANATVNKDFIVDVIPGTLTIVPAEVILTVKDNTVLAGTTEIPAVEFEVTKGAVTKGAVTIEQLAPSATWNVKTIDGKLVHGEYVNGEVTYTKSDNWKVVEIVDGKLTVELGDYVCWNPAAGIYWKDLSDALMIVSGAETEEVEMLACVEEDIIIVFAGTTLDLNGYYVEAGNLLSFGVVMDGAPVTGGIVISNDTTKAFTQLQPVNGGYLPIYDTVTGSYKFFKFTMNNQGYVPGNNSVTFWFRFELETAEGYTVLGRTTDSGIKLIADLTWTDITGVDITYTMSENTVRKYGQVGGALNGKGMSLTLRGLDKLPDGAVITETPRITTVAGVTGTTRTLTYETN